MKSLYAYSLDGDIKVIMGTHVDDLLYAAKDGYADIIDNLLAQFEIKETKENKFRFCGREYSQDKDFSITVTAKDNTEKTLPISYTVGNRSAEDKATAGEMLQLRTVNGS